MQSTNHNKAWRTCCIQILLLRKRLTEDPSTMQNSWLKHLKQAVTGMQCEKMPVNGLCDALLEMVESASFGNYFYWVEWFNERDETEHLEMLNGFIICDHLLKAGS